MRLLALLILLSSCSAGWHIQQAIKKDPSLSDTLRTITHAVRLIEAPRSDFDFSCLELMRGRVVHLYDTISIDNPSTPLNEERILSAVLRSDTLGNQSIEIKPAPCNERTIMVVEQLPSIPMTNKQKLKSNIVTFVLGLIIGAGVVVAIVLSLNK